MPQALFDRTLAIAYRATLLLSRLHTIAAGSEFFRCLRRQRQRSVQKQWDGPLIRLKLGSITLPVALRIPD